MFCGTFTPAVWIVDLLNLSFLYFFSQGLSTAWGGEAATEQGLINGSVWFQDVTMEKSRVHDCRRGHCNWGQDPGEACQEWAHMNRAGWGWSGHKVRQRTVPLTPGMTRLSPQQEETGSRMSHGDIHGPELLMCQVGTDLACSPRSPRPGLSTGWHLWAQPHWADCRAASQSQGSGMRCLHFLILIHLLQFILSGLLPFTVPNPCQEVAGKYT